uniref:Helitron_like_N domain-containing protein n=1 Tax=Caenorhabditis tropicalis TaxID=1561998 RepID=A0A1I7UGW4_9PELO
MINIILLIHLQTSQPQFLRDFITFTAHLRCNLTGNNFFRYRIQYFEEDVLLADDVLTRLDNVGSSTDGLAIDNNFAVTHGDGFLDNFYEMYALILHNCTSNKRKMRQIRHYFEPCSTQKGYGPLGLLYLGYRNPNQKIAN